MKDYFFIINSVVSDPQDIPEGARIFKMRVENLYFKFPEADGPYESLNELKRDSLIYKELKISNPKRAKLIIQEKLIRCLEQGIIWPDNNSEYQQNIYKILQHSTNGIVNRRGVLGIHFFDPKKIRIIELINPENEFGIFEAKIEVYNINSGKWIKKSQASTFFPKEWSLQRLINECYPAFMNKMKLTETKFVGKTYSGISVVFIYSGKVLKSIYPRCD